ncbi:CLUMA_CG002835, isoform A [Clunio marinus]|uniref:CLUMA_CG002835, isoform A n=1 Tax=Clunio marinus TaxID=568069 RepID=A0A1J1HNG0_9DIPT|nr:CLUMA_CG002835, isoform A [Clunio marinus]
MLPNLVEGTIEKEPLNCEGFLMLNFFLSATFIHCRHHSQPIALKTGLTTLVCPKISMKREAEYHFVAYWSESSDIKAADGLEMNAPR